VNTGYKISSNILCEHLQPHMDNIFGKCQCWFRNGNSTIDQIQSMRQILEKNSEYGISRLHLFVDLKAACDTIRGNKLLEALKEFKIPQN